MNVDLLLKHQKLIRVMNLSTEAVILSHQQLEQWEYEITDKRKQFLFLF